MVSGHWSFHFDFFWISTGKRKGPEIMGHCRDLLEDRQI